MTTYLIEATGEMKELDNVEHALDSSNVLIVVSHIQKKVFTWIGGKAAIQAKFACARESSKVRMELGYRIANLEEQDVSEDFVSALNETASSPKPKEAVKPSPKKVEKVEEIKETPVEQKPKTSSPKASPSPPISQSMGLDLIDIKDTLKLLSSLPTVDTKERDYVIIGDRLIIAPATISDEDEVDFMDSLPDGAFLAENYVPRLYLSDGKIVAVEFWRDE